MTVVCPVNPGRLTGLTCLALVHVESSFLGVDPRLIVKYPSQSV